MKHHYYRGAPVIFQIIKAMPQPISVRNWRFIAIDCTRRYSNIYPAKNNYIGTVDF